MDLSDFVAAKARAATHAIFEDISSQPPQTHGGPRSNQRPPPRNRSSFATHINATQGRDDIQRQPNRASCKCPLCNSDHWLSQCGKFKDKSLTARWQFGNSKGLCANCVAGHSANSCPKKRFCRVNGCNGNHSSYLHPRNLGPAPTNGVGSLLPQRPEVQERNQESGQPVFHGYVKERRNDRSAVMSLALVTVKVKAPDSNLIVEKYAFLENGSNASFCSEELATWLGLSGRSTSLTLTTMERESNLASAPCRHERRSGERRRFRCKQNFVC